MFENEEKFSFYSDFVDSFDPEAMYCVGSHLFDRGDNRFTEWISKSYNSGCRQSIGFIVAHPEYFDTELLYYVAQNLEYDGEVRCAVDLYCILYKRDHDKSLNKLKGLCENPYAAYKTGLLINQDDPTDFSMIIKAVQCDLSEAKIFFEENYHRGSIDDYVQYIRMLEADGRFEEAVDRCMEFYDDDPPIEGNSDEIWFDELDLIGKSCPHAYYECGSILESSEKINEAVKYYMKAYDSGYTEAYPNLVYLLFNDGDYAGIMDLVEKRDEYSEEVMGILKNLSENGNARASLLLGHGYRVKHQYEEALACYSIPRLAHNVNAIYWASVI